MLQVLSIATIQAAIHVLEIPIPIHRQLGAKIGVSLLTGISRPGLKARAVTLPKPIQASTQVAHGLKAQPPTFGVKEVQ